MTYETIPSRRDYPIPMATCWQGENQVVIVSHGFGSSKASPMVQALMKALPPQGIGVVAFDFPSHGDSPLWQEGLRVPYCMDDLAEVEAWVRRRNPEGTVHYFGSSFGAYITLLHLASHPQPEAKAFLRSSAVTMPALVQSWLNPRTREELAEKGWFVPDYDYVREMRITPAFLEDLEAHDLFARYRPGSAQVKMIHGSQDDVAPVEDARTFAHTFGAQLVELPQGEHPLMGPGELEEVLRQAAAFYLEG